jgi:hypothetical protein
MGEVAKTSWEGLSFDFDTTCMGLVWNEMKTTKQMDMNFHCERSVPEMDIFLNFAAFLMI